MVRGGNFAIGHEASQNPSPASSIHSMGGGRKDEKDQSLGAQQHDTYIKVLLLGSKGGAQTGTLFRGAASNTFQLADAISGFPQLLLRGA